MRLFALVLRIFALVIFLVSALHLVLGVGADVLVGAKVPAAAISDPALDSQNRLYGVYFALSGVLLLLCASAIPRYATVLRRRDRTAGLHRDLRVSTRSNRGADRRRDSRSSGSCLVVVTHGPVRHVLRSGTYMRYPR